MSKTWFAVGSDGGQNGWFAYQADSKFDAIWLYYQEHGAPQAGSERINAEIVPQWQGKEVVTEDDWRGTGYVYAYPCNVCREPTFHDLQAYITSRGNRYCGSCLDRSIDVQARNKVEGVLA